MSTAAAAAGSKSAGCKPKADAAPSGTAAAQLHGQPARVAATTAAAAGAGTPCHGLCCISWCCSLPSRSSLDHPPRNFCDISTGSYVCQHTCSLNSSAGAGDIKPAGNGLKTTAAASSSAAAWPRAEHGRVTSRQPPASPAAGVVMPRHRIDCCYSSHVKLAQLPVNTLPMLGDRLDSHTHL